MYKWLNNSTEILLKHFNNTNLANDSEHIKNYNLHKLRHSIWVLEAWRLILTKLKESKLDITLSDELIKKSELIFLLHDLWRFYQNDWNRILSGNEFDHWEKSYQIMLEEWYSQDLCLAVKYHDKLNYNDLFLEDYFVSLDENNQNELLFLTKILRDADKLQNILYTLFDFDKLIHLDKNNGIKDKDISELVLADLTNFRLVNRENLTNNMADQIALFLSWYFDIEFKETYQILKDNNFLIKTMNKLEKTNISKVNFSKIIDILHIYNN